VASRWSCRLAALQMLTDQGILNGDSNYILVEVFQLTKESEVGLGRGRTPDS
jgi:hypothetical protein